jgi:hypothetical protein
MKPHVTLYGFALAVWLIILAVDVYVPGNEDILWFDFTAVGLVAFLMVRRLVLDKSESK